MKISTSVIKRSMRSVAIVAAVGVASVMFDASAAYKAYTFCADGIIWKTGTKAAAEFELTAQKAGTKVTEGEAGPAVYEGDIKIPYKVTYNGKEYTVVKLGTVFSKNNNITSVTIAEGTTELSRAAFQNDSNLVSVSLPSTLTKMDMQVFYNCVSLKEVTIPGALAKLDDTQFTSCTSLSKLVIEDGSEPLVITASAFTSGGLSNLKELVLNRAMVATLPAAAPFRGLKNLESVTIGGSALAFSASTFENCSALKNVVFNNQPTEFGTSMFANTGLESFDFPASISTVPASCFANCKSLASVNIPEGVTRIDPMAFQNSGVKACVFPASLTNIGQMAFSGSKFEGELTLNAGLTSLGIQAFANTKINKVNIPASLKTISDGAFMGCASISAYAVDPANESLKVDETGSYVWGLNGEKDGYAQKHLYCFAPASALSEINEPFHVIAPYACYKASGLKAVNFGEWCETWGDYCLAETGISTLALKGNIGRYVASGSQLETLTVDNVEVPFGVAMGCAKLNSVTFVKPITVVKQDAFNGCAALESLNLGNILAILEADCFANSGIKTLTNAAAIPAGMAEGVFTAESGITVNVPVDYVNAYKEADGWKLLSINGDANIAAGPTDMGMPDGLYYAGEDGNIHGAYADGGRETFDVGGAPHTFQLIEYKNRIYGASAGKKFVYSATGSTDGDGKLFYLSQVGGNLFQAVVLDNYGLNAYKDPFGLYIYGEDLFVNDRNVCIRKIPAGAIALNPSTFPSWMENNWMGWYNQEWTYGCIKSGWAVTTGTDTFGNDVPEYWLGIKYNGNGIYRFRDENIGDASKPGVKPENSVFLNACNPIFTTFYIDEANQQMYIYVEVTSGTETTMTRGGLYRIEMSKLLANPNPTMFSDLNPQLIDGSPVKYEGSSTNEHVGISQLSPDGKGYLYWCYRAPTAEQAAANEAQDYNTMQKGQYWWAEKYDAANPLHQSGIKRIKLGEAEPKVEMVVPGVEGYGVVAVNYEGSKTPETLGVESVISNANDALAVNGTEITVAQDAVVSVYALNGTLVSFNAVVAGETVSVEELPAGAYIVSAVLADGRNAVVKVVK